METQPDDTQETISNFDPDETAERINTVSVLITQNMRAELLAITMSPFCNTPEVQQLLTQCEEVIDWVLPQIRAMSRYDLAHFILPQSPQYADRQVADHVLQVGDTSNSILITPNSDTHTINGVSIDEFMRNLSMCEQHAYALYRKIQHYCTHLGINATRH